MKFLKLRTKLISCFLIFAIIPVISFSYWTLQVLSNYSEDAVLESLRGLVRTKAQAIETFSNSRLANVEKLSSLSDVVSSVSTLLSSAKEQTEGIPKESLTALEKEGGELPQSVEEKREKVREEEPKKGAEKRIQRKLRASLNPEGTKALAALKKTLNVILSDQKEFEELLIIDSGGLVVASSFEGHEGKNAKGIEYFENGLKATFFQHVFISSITEKLTMVISTPIKTETGSVLGVFAARLNLDHFFKLIDEQSGLGRSGETILAKEISGEIVFMAPTRHDYKAALNRKIKLGSNEFLPLQEASRGQRGSGETTDYRDRKCLAAWEHISDLDWGILVKMDIDEATQPYMEAQYKTLFLTIGIIFIGVLLALFLANALINPLRELREAAERISKGDINVKLTINSNDEIGDLADSFSRMIAAVRFLMEEKSKD